MHAAILAFDGFDTLGVTGPFEVFGTARALGADLDLGTYTLGRRSVVTSCHGHRI